MVSLEVTGNIFRRAYTGKPMRLRFGQFLELIADRICNCSAENSVSNAT